MKNYVLKIVNSKEYDELARRYPAKIRNRLLKSKGFTDTKRKVSFIKSKRDKADMIGTAFHEILEMTATISPHDIAGIRCKGDSEPAKVETIQPTLTPEQKWYFEDIYKPYTTSQYGMWKDIYEPSSRQIGGLLQAQLTEPFQLPEDVWAKTWQKAREKTLGEYAPIERQATQRFASTGGLDTSGAAQKYFENLDFQKAKSIETLAIDQAIQEWQSKQQAKQQSIQNMFNYMQYQPSFGMELPTSQTVVTGGQPEAANPWLTNILPSALQAGGQIASMAVLASSVRYKKNIRLWVKH